LAAEKAEAEKIAAAKLAAEKAEAEKIAAAKLAAERAEAEKVAAAKLAAERAEAEKVAAAKLAAERAEAEKVAAAKLSAEKAEAERIAAAKPTINQVAGEQQEIRLAPHFPSFVATLQETDLETLDNLVEQLKAQKLTKVEVIGHSDSLPIVKRSRHIFADNLELSEARARNVAEYLQQHLGVSSNVIISRGLGDSMPMADNTTEAGRALNRRVEISLVTEPSENNIVVTRTTPQELAGLVNN
jgi:flagellar motor protein MotB